MLTIYVYSPQQPSSYDIYKSISALGEVDNISNSPIRTQAFAFSIINAEKINPMHTMNVNGTNMTITHQSCHTYKIQIAHHTLNNDCLYEIFKNLDYKDLCTLKTTCRLFNDMANDIIWKKCPANISTDLNTMQNVHLSQIEKFLCTAGNGLQKAAISNETHRKQIISAMVVRYCKNITELNCHVACDKPLDEYYRFFHAESKIEKLSVWGSRFRPIIYQMVTLPRVHMRHLKVLFVEHCRLEQRTFLPFIALNPQIEEIWLFNIQLNGYKVCSIARAICQLKNLKCLTYNRKHGEDRFIKSCRRMFHTTHRCGKLSGSWTFTRHCVERVCDRDERIV